MTEDDQEPKYLTVTAGRRLSYSEFGDPDGTPLFFFHGFPGSRLEATLLDGPARARQLRVIALDRPGYGGSDFVPGRRLLDWPETVVATATQLGIDRLQVLGVSGGGPYAYACAARLRDRLDRVGIICGVGPHNLPNAVASMAFFMRWGFRLAVAWPAFGVLVYRVAVGTFIRRFTRLAISLHARQARTADREILTSPDREIFRRATREAFRQGSRGPAHDLRIYASDWGFDLEEIRMPLQLWHGDADATVPVTFSIEVQKRLPQANLKRFPNDGHFSLPLKHTGEILDYFRDREIG